METRILQSTLKTALDNAKRFAESRPSLAQLSFSRFTVNAAEHRSTLTTYNFDRGITLVQTVGTRSDEDLDCAIPTAFGQTVVKTMPDERIDMTWDESTQSATLVCGTDKANLKGLTADEMPPTPAPGSSIAYASARDLYEAITAIQDCVATEDNRPILTAFSLQFEGNTLTLATADGYRLGKHVMPVGGVDDPSAWVCADAQALMKFAQVLKVNKDYDVSIRLNDTHISFECGSVEMIVRLADGRFPDFQAIIPKLFEDSVNVYPDEMLKACKKITPFARDNAYSCKLSTSEGWLTLTAKSQERGDFSTSITCGQTITPLAFSCNVHYLETMAKRLKSGGVMKLQYNGNTNPLVVSDEGQTLYVLMPMSVTE